MLIAIEGSIGAGKTSTAQSIAARLGFDLILENTDRHPFLHAFYEDPAKYALETELGFVLLHYHQLHPVTRNSLVVTDFSPVKDLAFARLNLRGEDASIFDHVYRRLSSRVRRPALAVFLEVDVDELLRRIELRGRVYERRMTGDYLVKLREAYSQVLDQLADHVRILPIAKDDTREAVIEKVMVEIRDANLFHSRPAEG